MSDRQRTTPCRHCQTYVTHSDRTGCCGRCKRVFKGLTGFDRHWTTADDGTRVCVDPLTVETASGDPVYETVPVPGGVAYRIRTDRPWRGPRS